MRRYGNGFLSLLLMIAFLYALVQINISSPHANVNNLQPSQLSENTLLLLEGGETVTDSQGQESYRLTLYWEGGGCLFLPKVTGCTLFVNGTACNDLASTQNRLFQFALSPSPDHIYEVVILPAGKTMGQYDRDLYLGSLAAVNACLSRQIISRYFVIGICFSILLFSLVLYLWKRSEGYLFWLALYALVSLIRMLDVFGLTLSPVFDVFFYLLIAVLNYQVMKHYLCVKLLGHSILLYIGAASLLRLISVFDPILFFCATLLFHIILYGCQILCIQKDRGLPVLERDVLSLGWIFAVALRLFSLLSMHNAIPHGNMDLQIYILAILGAIDITAFFIVACRRFALKFQEADNLNLHLEAAIQEKTREQTTFIRSMLHNLKTPLFSLVGYTDMAKESLYSPAGQTARYLNKIEEKAKYVSHMLDHLFLLTQLDANQLMFQKLPIRLADILKPVEENARLKGKEKGIRVSLSLAQNASCIGDPLYLQQAFQNIADNAVEHTGKNGSLSITVQQKNQCWEIIFQDNGCGISAEDMPRIFDRYYSNHHGQRNSSGLGLSIAKEIVQHHGGSITVSSEPQHGSCFTVILPVTSPQ